MKRLLHQCPRWLRILLIATTSIVVLIAVVFACGWWYLHPRIERIDGVVYGHRNERPLTLDVLQPENPNGLGVALMVSGGWKSDDPGEVSAWALAPLLRRGYTIFAICHVSQPDATVMEIIEDVHRGVRFVRHHARETTASIPSE